MASPSFAQDSTSHRQEEPKPTRSEAFWFESGDVVLYTENTQFRVHREMLSRHSNVFRDTFSMPQKAIAGHSDEVYVDGCPVVPLSDKASDVKHMLSIFYDNFQIHNWREPMHIDHLSTILRLGKKYEIDHFTKEAVRRLRSDHPTTLEAWDARTFYLEYHEIVWEDDEVDESVIINLAHEHSLPSILPAAYLRYIHTNRLDVIALEGTKLCSDGRFQCILGRAEIVDFIRDRLKDWYDHEVLIFGENCSSLEACAALRLTTADLEKYLLWGGFDDSCCSLLHPLQKHNLFGFCPWCTNSIRTRYNDNRAQLWEKLPTFFGLSDWEELKKKDFDM